MVAPALDCSIGRFAVSSSGMDSDEIAAQLPVGSNSTNSAIMEDMIAQHLPTLPMSTSTEALLSAAATPAECKDGAIGAKISDFLHVATSGMLPPTASTTGSPTEVGACARLQAPTPNSDAPPVMLGDALEFPDLVDGLAGFGQGGGMAGSAAARAVLDARRDERAHLPSTQSMELMRLAADGNAHRLERQRSDKSDRSDSSGSGAMGFLHRDDSFGSLDLKLSDTSRSSAGIMRTSSSSDGYSTNGDGGDGGGGGGGGGAMDPPPQIGDSFAGVDVDVSGRDLLGGLSASVDVEEEWVKIC